MLKGEFSNKDNSPFASVCDEFAFKFDEAEVKKDIDKTKELITEAKSILIEHDIPAYAPLFYSVGTSLAIVRDDLIKNKYTNNKDDINKNLLNPFMDSDVIEIHCEILWYLRHAEILLKQVEKNEKTKPYLDGIYIILFVNLGNALDFCGRKCSAIGYYSRALSCHPFGMAFGNIASCLEHYAKLEGDNNHRAVLLKKSYTYYLQAEKSRDDYTYLEAKQGFIMHRKQLETYFSKEALVSSTEYKEVTSETKKEKEYRDWCLQNHLFLNTLNDLLESNLAFASDSLHITSITTSIEQVNPPFVFEMFDQVKEEFIYARYLLFEVINGFHNLHFADKETYLDDVLNYSKYSIRIEKLKTAYRTIYSIFDQIAFLLNAYLNLGISERDVSFDRIWNKLKEKEKHNIAISALHWINRDFKDKFGDADTPHTLKLKDLRNALEHKFVSVHEFSPEKEIEIGEDFIYRVSEDHLVQYTIDLLKIVREAVIELTFAIRIEEYQRHNDNKRVARINLYEYQDIFKR